MSTPGFIPAGGPRPTRPQATTSSTFTGKSVTPVRPPSAKRPQPRKAAVQMKKSRFHQPLQPKQRGQMALPEDGTPIFAIFVRTSRAKLWYPLGAVQGDDRSKGLVNAMKGGFARSMYVNALDKGIAQTVYGKDSARFVQNALRMYPQLKKYSKDLEFGYRVAALGLDDQPTKAVSRDMALPFTAWAKKQLDNAFKTLKGQ